MFQLCSVSFYMVNVQKLVYSQASIPYDIDAVMNLWSEPPNKNKIKKKLNKESPKCDKLNTDFPITGAQHQGVTAQGTSQAITRPIAACPVAPVPRNVA